MKTKIQIKSICGDILFECEKESYTLKDALEEAVRYGINLRGADLNGENLCNADLREAFLPEANLSWTNLCGANLHRANLRKANFSWANLYDACLYGAFLSETDFYRANLNRVNLSEANLYGAKNVPYIPLNCPSDGAFIGWKKVHDSLIKLEIPEDARRSSATTMKCRCDKAKVLAITNLEGTKSREEIINLSQEHHVVYKVGEMVYPDSFDENRWNECSHGIHFFVNKQDAINY